MLYVKLNEIELIQFKLIYYGLTTLSGIKFHLNTTKTKVNKII